MLRTLNALLDILAPTALTTTAILALMIATVCGAATANLAK